MGLQLLSSSYTDAVTVSRNAPGTFVKGRLVPGVTSTFNEVASIQPTPFNDLLKNPEGDHYKDQRSFFGTFAFELNDKVEIDATGKKFLILKLGDWNRFSLKADHYEAVGISLDDQSE